MTANPGATSPQTFSGSFHFVLGDLIHSHAKRNQLRRSTAEDRAKVSAAKVLATTRSIFREYHTKGLARALFCWHTSSCTANTIPPF